MPKINPRHPRNLRFYLFRFPLSEFPPSGFRPVASVFVSLWFNPWLCGKPFSRRIFSR
jgi:hypothetical protein